MPFWIVFNLVQFEFLKNLDFKKISCCEFWYPPGGTDLFLGKHQNFICPDMGFFCRPKICCNFWYPPGVKKMTFGGTLKLCPCWQGDFHFWQVFEVCRNFEVFKTYRIVVKIDTILINAYFRNCFENWNSLTSPVLLRERVTLAQFDRKGLLFSQVYTL